MVMAFSSAFMFTEVKNSFNAFENLAASKVGGNLSITTPLCDFGANNFAFANSRSFVTRMLSFFAA
jgi:hypothetical protein